MRESAISDSWRGEFVNLDNPPPTLSPDSSISVMSPSGLGPHVGAGPDTLVLPGVVRRSAEPLDSLHYRAFHSAALHRGAPLKRAFDLLLTIVGGLIILPVVAIIAAAIKLSSPGPILFAHERIGRFGRRFNALKFRSMVINGDEVLEAYFEKHPEARAEWRRDHKLRNDPRVTGIGKILRKTSLDELPQIWNVLLGEMSLVGPRPIVREEIPKYGEDFDIYLQALPGVTGLWQVSGRNDTTYRQRVSLDVEYIATWSVWLDLHILLQTVMVVVGRRGAY